MSHYLSSIVTAAIGLALAVVVTGCGSLLPSSRSYAAGDWASFDAVKSAFDQITPGVTTVDELVQLGFDPENTANVRSLNYVELTSVFLPNPSMRLDELDPNVRECLQLGNDCRAYQLELSEMHRQRFGSVPLDIFGFRQYAHEEGWTFKALIVTSQNKVVHKVWSGSPHVSRIEKKKTPLGPLQEVDLGSAIRHARE